MAVTGGAGYIGSVLCRIMIDMGYQPVIIDNFSTGHKQFVQNMTIEETDIMNTNRLTQIFKHYNPSAVIHLAAYSSVGESTTNPMKYYNNNVVGCISVLDAMQSAKINHIVYSSSAAIFGKEHNQPIKEEDSYSPINPYGMTKLMCENIMHDYSSASDLRYIALRYFNAAGAHPSGEAGELHIPETHLIPLALLAAINPSQKFIINGNDYNTDDGTCIRDYIHVYDLAYAHILALRNLQNDNTNHCLNLGTGTGFSVKTIIDRIQHITGKNINYEIGKRREGDPAIFGMQ